MDENALKAAGDVAKMVGRLLDHNRWRASHNCIGCDAAILLTHIAAERDAAHKAGMEEAARIAGDMVDYSGSSPSWNDACRAVAAAIEDKIDLRRGEIN